jgi:Type VI secretion system/phage-baseplate injector OB domain
MNNEHGIAKCGKPYFGKYRGTVVNNVDPMQMGRIQALVPDVLGDLLSSWAMPALSVGGMQNGMFAVPIVGSGVWIEFEQGDSDYPIWTGCFFGSAAEVPPMARKVPPGVPGITLQTPGQNGLTISDLHGPTGGVLIQTLGGASISISDVGITITNGQGAKIELIGPKVSINGNALEVI